MSKELKCNKHGEYRQPGKYVAVCNKGNFEGHYVKVFEFPETGQYCGHEENYVESGVSAGWYFLNRVDFTACLDKVYPLEIFEPAASALEGELIDGVFEK